MEEPVVEFVVHGLLSAIDDSLEEKVGLLQLVVEEAIGLRELEGAEVVLLNHAGAQHVEASEKPAAARGFLVGDTLGGDRVGEILVVGGRIVGIGGQGVDGRACQGVAQGAVGGGRLALGLLDFLQHLVGDAAARCNAALCRHCENGTGQEE